MGPALNERLMWCPPIDDETSHDVSRPQASGNGRQPWNIMPVVDVSFEFSSVCICGCLGQDREGGQVPVNLQLLFFSSKGLGFAMEEAGRCCSGYIAGLAQAEFETVRAVSICLAAGHGLVSLRFAQNF